MVTFGSKAGSNVRDQLKRASGNGQFLTTLKDGKDLRVRFLQNPEDWYGYREHYSQSTNFFPCTQDDTCPGCNSESEQLQRSSKRYVASVLDVAQAKVVPLKMPIDLANRVTNKCDRNNGTLLDRDFTLIRTGKGRDDTTYDVEAEDKTPVDLSRYETVDPEPILAQSFQETFGDGPPAPVVDTSAAAQLERVQAQLAEMKAAQAAQAADVAPKVVASGPVTLRPPSPTPSTAEAQVSTSEISSPKEPSQDQTPGNGSDSTDDGFVSIEQLNAMDGDTLRKLVAENGLTPPEGAIDRDSLLEWLLGEFGVQ